MRVNYIACLLCYTLSPVTMSHEPTIRLKF